MDFNFAIPQPLDVDFDGYFDLASENLIDDGLPDDDLLSTDRVIEGIMNTSRFSSTGSIASFPIEFATPRNDRGFLEAIILEGAPNSQYQSLTSIPSFQSAHTQHFPFSPHDDLLRLENDPIQNEIHLANQFMNIVSQETTADNGAQQETLPEQDGDVNEDAGRPFATGRPGSQETSPNPYSDLIEVASQGVGMNQPSFQVILPVPEESPRPIIHIEIKKRTRKNKKPPGGNNSFGRRGTLACEQCRKRRSKCVFESKELPCRFCQSRNISVPCLKVLGPKTSSQLEPSRPIPTPIEGVISSEEVRLLDYAYSGKWDRTWHVTAIFRLLAIEYGASISSASLRHAMLAHCADRHIQTPSEVVEYHTQQARRGLIERLRTPNNICDADFFAILLLVFNTPFYGRPSEWFHHVRGTITIANHLSANKRMSHLMFLLEPLNHNNFNYVYHYARIRNLDTPCRGIPCPSPTMSQYFAAEEKLAKNSELPTFQGLGNFKQVQVIAFVGELLNLSYMCLCRIGSSEASEGGVQCDTNSLIDEIVDYIRNECTDIDFRQDIEVITRTFGIWTSVALPLDIDMMLVLQTTRCLDLWTAISRCRLVTAFFENPNAAINFDLILDTYRTNPTLLRGLGKRTRKSTRIYRQTLVLAGLSLSVEGVEKRKCPCFPQLLTPQDGRWLEDELKCLELDEVASCLKECWATGLSARSIACAMKAGLDEIDKYRW